MRITTKGETFMLYSIIIALTLLVMTGISILQNILWGHETMLYAAFSPLAVVLYVLVVLGILAVGLRLIVPKRFLNYKNSFFRVRKWQVKSLKKLGVQRWKDKVPDLGWTAGFPKSTIQSTDTGYLAKFLEETCFAEILHLTAGIFGLTALFVFPSIDFFVTFPIVIVNFILHLMPCLIQRYTRFRMANLYERKMREEARRVAQVEQEEQDYAIANN